MRQTSEEVIQALGWCIAELCVEYEKGTPPTKYEVPKILQRYKEDFTEEGGE